MAVAFSRIHPRSWCLLCVEPGCRALGSTGQDVASTWPRCGETTAAQVPPLPSPVACLCCLLCTCISGWLSERNPLVTGFPRHFYPAASQLCTWLLHCVLFAEYFFPYCLLSFCLFRVFLRMALSMRSGETRSTVSAPPQASGKPLGVRVPLACGVCSSPSPSSSSW